MDGTLVVLSKTMCAVRQKSHHIFNKSNYDRENHLITQSKIDASYLTSKRVNKNYVPYQRLFQQMFLTDYSIIEIIK